MTTQAPPGWKFEFDCADEHCASYIEGELSSPRPQTLSDALQAFEDGGPREELRRLTTEQLTQLEAGPDRESWEELEDALRRHEGDCGCVQWSWDSDREYLEQLLDEIEESAWFVSNGADWDLLQDYVRYENLAHLLGRSGWYHLSVAWDPATGLRVETESRRIELVPASSERLALSEAASEIGHWDCMRLAKEMPAEHLAIATALADAWIASGQYYTAEEAGLLLALPEGVAALEISEEEIACSLVHDWSGSLPELLEAARSLVHV